MSRSFRVFWSDNLENERDFGLKEFLFDISVCEVAMTESAFRGRQLSLVRNAVWQIESEFAKNSREALYDFGKLVMGSAQNKLFIAPLVSREEEFLRVLREPASFCSGSVSLAMVPHPNDWPQPVGHLKLWRFAVTDWSEV